MHWGSVDQILVPSDNFVKLGEEYNIDTITKGRAKNKLNERHIR